MADEPNPSPTPDDLSKEAAQKQILQDISNLVEKTTSNLEKISNIESDRLSTAEKYSREVQKANAAFEQQHSDLFKLEEGDRKRARHELEKVKSQLAAIESAEKYFNIGEKTLEQERKRAQIREGIVRAAAMIGLGTEETGRIRERAERGFKIEDTAKIISGWVGVAKAIGSAVDIQFQSEMAGARGRAFALMRGANLPETALGTGGFFSLRGTAQETAGRMFGGVPTGVMGPLEQMQQFSRVLREAPNAAKETTDNMTKLIGTLAYFGTTIDETIETLIRGTRESNLTALDISRTYLASNRIAQNLGLSTKETADTILEMTKAIRQAGGTSNQAANILSTFSGDITAMGQSLSAIEKQDLARRFATGVAGMPIDKLLGILQFTTGRPIQAMGPGDLAAGSVFGAAKVTFDKILAQTGQSYSEQLVATEKVGQLLGVNVSSARDVEALYKVMSSSSMTQDQINRQLEIMANPAKVTAEGIESLKSMIDPLQQINNTAKSILASMNPIGYGMQKLATILGAGAVGGRIAGAAGSIVGKTAAEMVASGIIAAGGAGAIEAAGVTAASIALPVAAVAVGVPLVVAGGSWAYHKIFQPSVLGK